MIIGARSATYAFVVPLGRGGGRGRDVNEENRAAWKTKNEVGVSLLGMKLHPYAL
jgi:hypothetical protein